MSKFKFVQWYGIVVCLLMAACTDVDITMPKGPKGDTGLRPMSLERKSSGRNGRLAERPDGSCRLFQVS